MSQNIKNAAWIFLCWRYDEKYEVYGIPIEREVINKDTSCIMMNYYLQRLEKNNV